MAAKENSMDEALNTSQLHALNKLRAEVDELHQLWRDYDPDGHCKSSEGHIEVSLDDAWARLDGEAKVRCSIYSYLFGPHRSHDFDSIEEALVTWRKWAAEYRRDLRAWGVELPSVLSVPSSGENT